MLPILLPILFAVGCSNDIKIMQISDFHMDVDYSVNGDRDRLCHASRMKNVIRNRTLGTFGDYKCDSPMSLVENTVNSAASLFPTPDLILWTGDNVPHVDDYSIDYLMRAIQKTTQQLKNSFPNTQILPTYGNHDHAPSGLFAEDDHEFYNRTFELWKNWIGEDKRRTFLKGGYYSFQYLDTMFLVLNTNYYYVLDTLTFKNPEDPSDQFKFMEDQLNEARKKGQAVNIVGRESFLTLGVVLIAHISPGMYENKANFSWFRDEYNARFLDIVNGNLDIIKIMVFGHHHTDTWHLIRDKSGKPTQACFISPAVTPWYSSLGDVANNPAFRVYKFDSQKTWILKDIETYYVNLTRLNRDQSTQWELEYSFKNSYGLKDFSAASLDDLIKRMETNDTLFSSYLDYNGVLYSQNTTVNYSKRQEQLCSLKHADYVAYRECLKSFAERSICTGVLLLLGYFWFT